MASCLHDVLASTATIILKAFKILKKQVCFIDFRGNCSTATTGGTATPMAAAAAAAATTAPGPGFGPGPVTATARATMTTAATGFGCIRYWPLLVLLDNNLGLAGIRAFHL